MRPYDQLPFQFSVHSQKEPAARLEHHEFLATDAIDPRREFIRSLCAALGECGSIVVYNAEFESQRLSELAAWLPEYADRIKNIQARLWDLLPVVRSHVYHPAFVSRRRCWNIAGNEPSLGVQYIPTCLNKRAGSPATHACELD